MNRSLGLMLASTMGLGVFLGSCEGGDGGNPFCTTEVYDPNTGTKKDFGVTAAAKKVKSFLDTSAALVKAAGEIDKDLLAVCTAMATELGIPAADLAPPAGNEMQPGAMTNAACTRVKIEIDTILMKNLPKQATLTIVATPAVCSVSAEAQLKCVQECETTTVTETEVHCKPGKLYGTCMGTCMLTCKGSCAGGCEGSCTAGCNGRCDATCQGTCVGTCATKNTKGECIGKCEGTCMGTCTGTCTGTCSGSCSGKCMASCMGECHGGCSVMYTAPKCEEVEVTREKTDCTTSCDARARLEAKCTEPKVEVSFGVDTTPEQKAKLDKLVLALRNHLPKMLAIAYRAGTVIKSSVEGYQQSLSGITQAAKETGVQAVACMAVAGEAIARAAAQIQISVTVSVSVSASVAAQGGA